MDMRQYASTYIKPDNVRESPIQTRIVNVYEDTRLKRPVLELETGSQFTLNETNSNTLIKAWGHNSDDWISQEIELLLGTYKDWDSGEDKETVKVRAVSPAKTAAANDGAAAGKPPLPPSRTKSSSDDMDDSIPF